MISSNMNTPRRRCSVNQTQSTMDLRRVSDDDSSSEENMQRSKASNNGGRRRSNSHDRRPSTNLTNMVVQSEKDLSRAGISGPVGGGPMGGVGGGIVQSSGGQNMVRVRTKDIHPGGGGVMNSNSVEGLAFKPRTKMKTTTRIVGGEIVTEPFETLPVRDGSKASTSGAAAGSANLRPGATVADVTRAPLTWHLVEQTANNVLKSSDDLVQLYKRISLDYELEEGPRSEMLHKLANMSSLVQHTLRPVGVQGHPGGNGELPRSTSAAANPYFHHMIENYSNSMMQNQGGPTSMPMHHQQSSSRIGQQDPKAAKSSTTTTALSSSSAKGNKGPSWC